MTFPFPGGGVVFDIGGLGGGFYGLRAWQLFMKCLDPTRLAASVLVEGDTAATLRGSANEFCIGIYGPSLDLDYVRDSFEALDDPGLAPFHRRFIERLALEYQPLPIRGTIDAFGRLVTNDWDSFDHRLCKENGWGYVPRNVSPDLDPSLRADLEQLKRPRF
jgi:hypothetical protein